MYLTLVLVYVCILGYIFPKLIFIQQMFAGYLEFSKHCARS